MKIKIISCEKDSWWYADYIGMAATVCEERGSDYFVNYVDEEHNEFGLISKCDAEIITEQPIHRHYHNGAREMNIYDKLPVKFIRWAVEHGMELTLGKDYIDLNTGMKSGLHLYYEDDKYVAKMRYNKVETIETFWDLYMAVRDCEHGKGFMFGGIAYLYNNGFGEIESEGFE